jgi:hypothetical protein
MSGRLMAANARPAREREANGDVPFVLGLLASLLFNSPIPARMIESLCQI